MFERQMRGQHNQIGEWLKNEGVHWSGILIAIRPIGRRHLFQPLDEWRCRIMRDQIQNSESEWLVDLVREHWTVEDHRWYWFQTQRQIRKLDWLPFTGVSKVFSASVWRIEFVIG